MRKSYEEYYGRTDEELESLWQSAVIVLDTNSLLDLYRFSEEASKQYIEVLGSLKEQLWIPYHVGYEFQERRLTVIGQQEGRYQKVCSDIDMALSRLGTDLQDIDPKRHPILTKNAVLEPLAKTAKNLKKKVLELQKTHPDYRSRDSIRDALDELYEGRVGPAYDESRLQDVYEEAKRRYERRIPPGFKDQKNNKPEPDVYGDVVLWFQMLDYAGQQHRPVIFVTGESHDDWWREDDKGRKLGPRPELLREMRNRADVGFHMYNLGRFIDFARNRTASGIQLADSSALVSEVVTIQRLQADEESASQSGQLKRVTEEPAIIDELDDAYEELRRLVSRKAALQSPYGIAMGMGATAFNIYGTPESEVELLEVDIDRLKHRIDVLKRRQS